MGVYKKRTFEWFWKRKFTWGFSRCIEIFPKYWEIYSWKSNAFKSYPPMVKLALSFTFLELPYVASEKM